MNNEFPVTDDPATWPVCFVVSPIGNPGTAGRHRADLFLKFIVEPVLTELGYRALRADMIAAGGLVTSQIVRHLVDDPLVIADLTDHNPNVMYELAIRHAAQRPFVQLIDKNQTIPFDVGQQRTIFFDITDLLSVDNCKKDLKRHIQEATAPGAEPVETPVRRLLEIGNLSAGSKDDALAQLAARIDTLTARLQPVMGEHLAAGILGSQGFQVPLWPRDDIVEAEAEAEATRAVEIFVEELKKHPELYKKWRESRPLKRGAQD